jgi:F-type H+-transporting ATPase subunit gamma
MPSLKDLRNRIASVKSTQKITKAMQMVAAAKLRRAQEAAEARVPMPSAWPVLIANLAAGVCRPTTRRKLLAGTGKDQKHLLVVATGERGLCRRVQHQRRSRARRERINAAGRKARR